MITINDESRNELLKEGEQLFLESIKHINFVFSTNMGGTRLNAIRPSNLPVTGDQKRTIQTRNRFMLLRLIKIEFWP